MTDRQDKEPLKACVITGTRAEYGLLYWTLRELDQRPDFDLRLVVTGTHTSKHHGNTITEIEADGFKIDDIIEIQIDGDSRAATAKTTGIAMMGFADYFRRTKPDFVMLLGDRYESFAAASSSFLMGIPIVHLCGGDISRGAFDDSLRHAISKFASLHCVTQESHRQRLIQLGEESWRIANVGNISAESILRLDLLSYQETIDRIGVSMGQDYVLCTYHPTTAGAAEDLPDEMIVENLISELLEATPFTLVFTGTNADPDAGKVSAVIGQWAAKHPNRVLVYQSLGRKAYLSAMKFAKAVAGNSSSGVLEAPVFKIPSIDLGSRQEGRVDLDTVFSSSGSVDDLSRLIGRLFGDEVETRTKQMPVTGSHEPYASERIVGFLSGGKPILNKRKSFVDIGCYKT